MKLAFYFVGINFDARKRNPPPKGAPRGGGGKGFFFPRPGVIFQAHQIPERSFSYMVVMVTNKVHFKSPV